MTEWIVSSSAIILIVIALRGLLKGRISLRLQYALWALVLVRLLLPISLVESAISVSNFVSDREQQTEAAVEDYQESLDAAWERFRQDGETPPAWELEQQVQQELYERTYERIEQSYALSGETVPEVQMQAEAMQQAETVRRTVTVMEVLPYLWAGGMVLVAAVLAASNLHFAWRLRRSRTEMEIDGIALKVYRTDYVATPCLFGIRKPAIYLTGEITDNTGMRQHVVAHELSHYQQRDHIWSVLRCLCLVLHWYNPLVWWAAVLSKRDAELACDERTIRTLGEDQRTEYGRTLISMTCVRRDPKNLMLTATTMQGTKKALKERIRLIAKRPKAALYTIVACVVVVAIAVGCTFTGAPDKEKKPSENTDPTEPSAESTEPVEQTEPVGFENISDEALLERCREAVEYIQSLEYYQILERADWESNGSVKADMAWTTARYLHAGDDWYHILGNYPEFLQKNGRQFRRSAINTIPKEENPYSEWTEVDLSKEPLAAHCWITGIRWGGDRKLYQDTWDGDTVECNILSVTAQTERNREVLTLTLEVLGEEEKPDSCVLTFRIDSQTNQVVGVEGVVESDGLTSIRELTITAAKPETVEKLLAEFWREATGEELPDDPGKTDPEDPVQENLLAALDLEGMFYSGTPEDYYPFVYDPDGDYLSLGEDAAEKIHKLTPGQLYTLHYDTGKIYPIVEERVVGLHATERYLFSLTQTNTLVVSDMTGAQKLVLYRGEAPIQPGSLGYLDGTLYFVEGNSVRNLDLATGNVGLLTIYQGAVDADPVYNVAAQYPHLLYIRTASDDISCNLLIGETAVLDTDAKRERFLEDGTWPVEQELTVEYFTQLLSPSKGYWYHRIMGSVFGRPSEISLEHTFYTGMELISVRNDAGDYTIVMDQRQWDFSNDEAAFLEAYKTEQFGDMAPAFDAHKLPRKSVEAVLQTCLGVTLKDVTIPERWAYYDESDAFYDFRSDAYVLEGQKITDVVVSSDGTIHVYWNADRIVDMRSGERESIQNPQMLMTLRRNNDGSFQVLSNTLQ